MMSLDSMLLIGNRNIGVLVLSFYLLLPVKAYPVVGGEVVSEHFTYPFMVSVQQDPSGSNDFQHACGGSLIADIWVATAAHCVRGADFGELYSPSKIAISIGSNEVRASDNTLIIAEEIHSHPSFDYETNRNDIALIRLSDTYEAPSVSVPAMGVRIPALNDKAIVLGWGDIDELGTKSNILRQASLKIVRNTACFPFFPNIFDSRSSFCAIGNSTHVQDTCTGDSGGPLLVSRNDKYVLAGIVSFGAGCGRSGVPSVYTRIESYANWISVVTDGAADYVNSSYLQVEDKTIIKLEEHTSVSASLLAGTVDYYDVSGATKINLISDTGDVDLFVIRDAYFQIISEDLILCSSENTEAIDDCAIEQTEDGAYAIVFGFVDTEYTIYTQ